MDNDKNAPAPEAPAPAAAPAAPAAPVTRATDTLISLSAADLDRIATEAATRAIQGITSTPNIVVTEQERAARSGRIQGVEHAVLDDLTRHGRLIEVARNGYGDCKEAKAALVEEYWLHRFLGRWYENRATVPYEQCVRTLSGDIDAIRRAQRGGHVPDHMVRTLTTTGSTAGAELVATEYVRELIVNLQYIAEFRPFTTVIQMMQNSVNVGKYTKGKTARRRGELVALTDEQLKAAGEPTGSLILTAKTLIAETEQISRESVDDFRAGDLLALISEDIAEDIAQKEVEDFTIGTGTATTPQGMHDAEAGFTTISQDGSTPTYDDIVRLRRSVPRAYRRNGANPDPSVVYITNNEGLSILERIKDENGHPYYKAATADEEYDTFASRPILELPDVPGEGTEEDPTFLSFGNLRKAMVWGDRQTLEIESTMEANDNYDDHSFQVKGTTRSDCKPRETAALVHMSIWGASSGS